MNKFRRLGTIHKLVKLQEKMVLAEFSELQLQSEQLKQQLQHFAGIKRDSNKKLSSQNVYIHELASIRTFAQNLETAIAGIRQNLEITDNNYSLVAERIKELRTTLLSIERLLDKVRVQSSNELALTEQKQTEEFLSNTQNPLC